MIRVELGVCFVASMASACVFFAITTIINGVQRRGLVPQQRPTAKMNRKELLKERKVQVNEITISTWDQF